MEKSVENFKILFDYDVDRMCNPSPGGLKSGCGPVIRKYFFYLRHILVTTL